MKNLNQEWYPSEEYLDNIKKIVDRLLDNNTPHEYFYYEGAGRTVVIIDKVAVKIPEYNEEDRVDGFHQNKKEYEIYTKTKHHLLNPVYEMYRDCLICKEVMADILILEEEHNFKYQDIVSEINKGINEISDIISEHSLCIEDISAPRNWGYDFDCKKFVCVDYGCIAK